MHNKNSLGYKLFNKAYFNGKSNILSLRIHYFLIQNHRWATCVATQVSAACFCCGADSTIILLLMISVRLIL